MTSAQKLQEHAWNDLREAAERRGLELSAAYAKTFNDYSMLFNIAYHSPSAYRLQAGIAAMSAPRERHCAYCCTRLASTRCDSCGAPDRG